MSYLCLRRIVKYMQLATTTTDHDVRQALPERRASTVADAAPALARGPRPLLSPEAVGGGARSRHLTLCGSLRSAPSRRCQRRRRGNLRTSQTWPLTRGGTRRRTARGTRSTACRRHGPFATPPPPRRGRGAHAAAAQQPPGPLRSM